MQEKIYSLEAILSSIAHHNQSNEQKTNAKKRLIFDQSPLGGIGSKWVYAFFISLPIIEYAGIFNPLIFPMLGIAQAIIFYIIFLSMLMIMVIALAFINNTKVVRQITPSWRHYFPEIDLKMVLTSGASPYANFFKHYATALQQNLQAEALHSYLKDAFVIMGNDNKELLEAMQNQTSRTR